MCPKTVRAQGETVTITKRPDSTGSIVDYVKTSHGTGATQGFVFQRQEHPFGTVILIPGGAGSLNLDGEDAPDWKDNFAARIRFDVVRAGFSVALVDPPSRDIDPRKYRTSPDEALNLQSVIAYARSVAPGPVFLLGMSRGGISAANAAARLPAGSEDGLILVSSVTLPTQFSPAVLFSADLKSIRAPVLMIHHRDDQCATTPAASVPIVAAQLKRGTSVDVRMFQGGKPTEGDECESRSPHGFYGIEPQVVDAMVAWMKAHGAGAAARGK